MNKLEQLSAAWRWAQQEQKIAPEFVEHHIDNMRDALNKGLVIVPSVTFDCHGTLIHTDSAKGDNGCNRALYGFGKAVCNHLTIDRELTLASSKSIAPDFTAEMLDDNFDGNTKSKISHDEELTGRWWQRNNRRYELGIDDLGMKAEFARSYVSVAIPTWDSRLIRFPS